LSNAFVMSDTVKKNNIQTPTKSHIGALNLIIYEPTCDVSMEWYNGQNGQFMVVLEFFFRTISWKFPKKNKFLLTYNSHKRDVYDQFLPKYRHLHTSNSAFSHRFVRALLHPKRKKKGLCVGVIISLFFFSFVQRG